MFALVAACSSPARTTTVNSDAGSTGVVNADYSSALCAQMQRCIWPLFILQYASLDDCVSDLSSTPFELSLLNGVTSAELTAITNLLNDDACAPLLSATFTLPSYGSLVNGAACLQGWQCQSGTCVMLGSSNRAAIIAATSSSQHCGTCGGGGQGAACTSTNDCSANYACIDKACQTRLPIGGACTSSDECQSGYCLVPSGATSGQCADIALDVPAGSPCSISHACQSGMLCDASTNNICPTPNLVSVGGSCSDSSAKCVGSYCDTATNRCTAYPANGTSCNVTKNHCRHACVPTSDGGTTGTCQTYDPADLQCN